MAIRRLLFLRRSTSLLSLPSRLSAKPVKLPYSALHRDYRDVHSSAGPLRFRASDFFRAPVNAAVEYAYEETVEEGSGGGDASERLEIAKLGISEVIVNALAKKEITKLFPIQGAVLQPAMQGRDMIGRARTGTGKTLAFGIPIMDKIIQFNAKHGRGRNPLALVMAPTRELARQVEKEFRESSDLATICVYGGTPIYQQMQTLNYGVDVVVGTPGRIIDLLKRGALNLSEVQFVVLDEADQMLAVGFAEDVEVILEKLPKQRQSMMFSATMPNWITQLTRKYLNDPLTIDLVGDSDKKLAEGITLYSIVSDNYGKPSVVAPLIAEYGKGGKCIVFTQTKRDADRLAYFLGKNLRCEALHGDITQAKREKTLSSFRDGHFNVLVATDVAARGLDVPNVDLVIHYELPNNSEIFVHRSGRTGRAGKKGSAILIHTEQQAREVHMIEQHIGCRFKELPRIAVEGGAGLSMFGDTGSHWGSADRPRGGGSTYGNSNINGGAGFGRTGGFSRPSGRSNGYGGMGSNRSSFAGSTNSRPSGGYGHSGFNSSEGNIYSGFGRSSNSVGSGSGPSGHSTFFGGPNSSHTNGFPNSGSSFNGGSGTFTFGDSGSRKSGPHVDSNSSVAGGLRPSNFGFGGSGDGQSGSTF